MCAGTVPHLVSLGVASFVLVTGQCLVQVESLGLADVWEMCMAMQQMLCACLREAELGLVVHGPPEAGRCSPDVSFSPAL